MRLRRIRRNPSCEGDPIRDKFPEFSPIGDDFKPQGVPKIPPKEYGRRYCLRCGADLGLPHYTPPDLPECHDCGLLYDPSRPETFGPRPPAHFQLSIATLVILVIVAAVVFATLRATGQTMGTGMFFTLPLALGIALGYLTNARLWIQIGLGITAILCLAGTLIFASLTGMFCGLILAAIFVGPLLAGVVIGWALQKLHVLMTKRRRPMVLAALLVLPFATEGLERVIFPATELAEVRTTAVFDAPPETSWDAILLYEQVDHPPPFLLRLALPKPIRAEGRNDFIGAEQTCIYDRGYLVKRITRREPPRVLAFDVVAQHVHFEHDVELRDGAFLLDPLPGGRTKVTLVTRYRRLLRPGWLWRPMERAVVRALHRHVLEGMRRKAAAETPPLGEMRRAPGSS